LDAGASSRQVHHVKVLMEPDADRGPESVDEADRNSRLTLGARADARIELGAGCPNGAPPEGKVAIEVDPPGVLAGSHSVPVGVEVEDDPYIGVSRRGFSRQRLGDGDSGALVPMQAADQQQPALAGWIPHFLRADRPASNGAPKDYSLVHDPPD